MKTLPIPRLSISDVDRFQSHVNRQSDDACWLWMLATDKNGYGKFSIKQRTYRAHRVAYFIHYDTDPGDLLVCHTCDNPVCCNPSHLFLGDNKANINDARDKGRLNTASGDKHGSHTRPDRIAKGELKSDKLTEPQVIEIRRLYRDEQWTQRQIANQFSISRELVSRIIRGLNWRYIAERDETPNLSDPSRKVKHGSEQSGSKLTEAIVREIRKQLNQGVPRKTLAKRYGVSTTLINHIANGRLWKHVN